MRISIEKSYEFYLKKVGLSEDKMHEDQKRETRRAFYGAWGILLNEHLKKLADLKEEEAVRAIEDMVVQVEAFWLLETESNDS